MTLYKQSGFRKTTRPKIRNADTLLYYDIGLIDAAFFFLLMLLFNKSNTFVFAPILHELNSKI